MAGPGGQNGSEHIEQHTNSAIWTKLYTDAMVTCRSSVTSRAFNGASNLCQMLTLSQMEVIFIQPKSYICIDDIAPMPS